MEACSIVSSCSGGSVRRWYHRPGWPCAIVTTLAIPPWFLVLAIYAMSRPAFGAPQMLGLLIYGGICAVAAVPAGLFNAVVLAPAIAFPLRRRGGLTTAVLSNVVVFMAVGVVFWLWGNSQTSGRIVSGWECMFWYLSIFFIPPIIIGSLAHSLVTQALAKKRASAELTGGQ